MEAQLLPSTLFRCPSDPRDYEVREETFYMPFYQHGEDYSQPHDHRYSYGAVNVDDLRAHRRLGALPGHTKRAICRPGRYGIM